MDFSHSDLANEHQIVDACILLFVMANHCTVQESYQG